MFHIFKFICYTVRLAKRKPDPWDEWYAEQGNAACLGQLIQEKKNSKPKTELNPRSLFNKTNTMKKAFRIIS